MGISLDYERAEERLDEAIVWARSERDIPTEWAEATEEIGASPSKTYVAALGTGLLARATDERVDALALKVKSGPDAYSARTLAHNVLVPPSLEFGYDLGATGREPLNNQPFFRYDRIDECERIASNAEPFHEKLVGYLEAANKLDPEEALGALAAFLRVRIEVAESEVKVDLRNLEIGLSGLLRAVRQLLAEDAEGGKRAQAFAAAVVDLVYDRVRMVRINDPSRRFPGDVQAYHSSRALPVLAVEVRAKPVEGSEVRRFVRSVAEENLAHCMVLAFSEEQPPLTGTGLEKNALNDAGVLLDVYESPPMLLRLGLSWSSRPLPEVLAEFPDRMQDRLMEIEVRESTIERWAELCAGGQPDMESGSSTDEGQGALKL